MPTSFGGTIHIIPDPVTDVPAQATSAEVLPWTGVSSRSQWTEGKMFWLPVILGAAAFEQAVVGQEFGSGWLEGWPEQAPRAEFFTDPAAPVTYVHYELPRAAESWRWAAARTRWWRAAAGDLNKLAALPVNWDSYGSPPPAPPSIVEAITLLWQVMRPANEAPGIVPLSDGGLQLEWSAGPVVIEVITGDVEDRGIFIQDATGSTWEGSLDEREDVLRLALQLAGEAEPVAG